MSTAAAGNVPPLLVGEWVSTEAFGNTALDWSKAVKAGTAVMALAFAADATYTFQLRAADGADVTANFQHVIARTGAFSIGDNNSLLLSGDDSGIHWSFQLEEDDTLRIRLEGARRFGRCKGVDVIYFKRASSRRDDIKQS